MRIGGVWVETVEDVACDRDASACQSDERSADPDVWPGTP
jgi:hypothetical protein